MITFEYLGYNGVPAFKSDDAIKELDEIVMSKDINDDGDTGLLFVRATSNPKVFHYGFTQYKANTYHEAGYTWSSRTGVLNSEFDADFVNVYVNNRAGLCMRKSDVEELIPEDYEVYGYVNHYDDEPYFQVRKKS